MSSVQHLLEQLTEALHGHEDDCVLGVTSDHIGWEALSDPMEQVHHLHVRDLRVILTALREALAADAEEERRDEHKPNRA